MTSMLKHGTLKLLLSISGKKACNISDRKFMPVLFVYVNVCFATFLHT